MYLMKLMILTRSIFHFNLKIVLLINRREELIQKNAFYFFTVVYLFQLFGDKTSNEFILIKIFRRYIQYNL